MHRSKLENYGVNGNNLHWFQSYLKNREQYLNFNNKITSLSLITCGVSQGSILGPLLFLIYANDLNNTSDSLDPISIHQLFTKVNEELKNPEDWFKASKLSLNNKKTKSHFTIKNPAKMIYL